MDLQCAERDLRIGEFLLAQLDRFAEAFFGFRGILEGEIGQTGLVMRFVKSGGFGDGGLEIDQGRLRILFDVKFFPAGGEQVAGVLRDGQVARGDG